MKKQMIFVVLIILMLPFTTSANVKIQIDDNWIYVDSYDKQYNETALSNVQILSGDTAISMMKTNTSRGYSFPYSFTKTIIGDKLTATVTFELNPPTNGLYVTQEKGIVLYPVENITGTVTLQINNKVITFNAISTNYIMRSGDPSLAFVTTSSEKYVIDIELVYNQTDEHGFFIYNHVKYAQEIVVSTNQDITDDIRNYTFTPNWIQVGAFYQYAKDMTSIENELLFTEYQTGIIQYAIRQNDTYDTGNIVSPLQLNQFDSAILMTFDSKQKLPTYIKQTELAKIGTSLSLSQSYETVEYFLVQSSIESEEEKTFTKETTFLMIFIPIMVLIRRKSVA